MPCISAIYARFISESARSRDIEPTHFNSRNEKEIYENDGGRPVIHASILPVPRKFVKPNNGTVRYNCTSIPVIISLEPGQKPTRLQSLQDEDVGAQKKLKDGFRIVEDNAITIEQDMVDDAASEEQTNAAKLTRQGHGRQSAGQRSSGYDYIGDDDFECDHEYQVSEGEHYTPHISTFI